MERGKGEVGIIDRKAKHAHTIAFERGGGALMSCSFTTGGWRGCRDSVANRLQTVGADLTEGASEHGGRGAVI